MSKPLIVKSRRDTSSSALDGENDLIRVPAIGIADVTAKGSHFDFSRSAENLHNSELRANREALREKLQDPFREGVRGDVVIGGLAAN